MDKGQAINTWNHCCMRTVGVYEDNIEETPERLGLICIGAGIPLSIDARLTPSSCDHRKRVVAWLRDMASAIESIES